MACWSGPRYKWALPPRTLFNRIVGLGVDRVLFSADCPYETMEEAASWFDSSLLCANDARKMGRDNACRLFSTIA